jgi:Holliday junction DNA helicase RuvA
VYEYLEGRVASRHPARLVVDVGGVGFDLAVPIGADFHAQPDGRLRVWTHLVVREDAHQLFGFPSSTTREVFRLLLRVRGVGPSLALAILSGLPGEELLDAISAGDPRPLQRIKGVGKKTADQILLDLRDRAARFARGSERDGTIVPRGTPAERSIDDAVRALVSIGYSEKEAQRSVEEASRRVNPEDLELLVRAALKG